MDTQDKQIFCFAGPNGAGKSSTISEFIELKICPDYYICPDLLLEPEQKNIKDEYIKAMEQAEWLRKDAVENGRSMTFETVFSTRGKLDFIRYAKGRDYSVSTIYITTSNPEINIKRVRKRVSEGGHSVPEDKIVSRYEKCMRLMPEALIASDSASVYDNSIDDERPRLVIVKTDGCFEIIRDYLNLEWVRKYLVYPLTDLDCKITIIKDFKSDR